MKPYRREREPVRSLGMKTCTGFLDTVACGKLLTWKGDGPSRLPLFERMNGASALTLINVWRDKCGETDLTVGEGPDSHDLLSGMRLATYTLSDLFCDPLAPDSGDVESSCILSLPHNMTHRDAPASGTRDCPRLSAAIFDVDGVLLASPHERAWREALRGVTDEARFTTAMYQSEVAGKPRLSGALAALRALRVPNAEQQAAAYAERKQKRLEALIDEGGVAAFPDALRFVLAISALGWPIAVASSSKNANGMMRRIRLDDGRSLLEVFRANVCGRDLRQGKPAPEIFLLAAAELPAAPAHCCVVEDAPAGIQAARACGMAAIGVARRDDAALLRAAGAHVVVTSLDEISIDELALGRLGLRVT